ncbi:single-stranded DNA-binding protein [Agromyces sp. NPDC056523]|uniref:single-stranded DNA-binding protein n=1 Tax=Agromyces sp. NPDC056523 TaxID=3345850 RepID=UPI00367308F9
MTDQITVTGAVGSDPRHTVTPAGLPITNFRLASTRRYFDRATGQWTDGETNWYTVSTFRQLAVNAAESLRKGQRVVVHGRVRVRKWQTAEKSGLAIELEADSVGHDLAWGTSEYTKSTARASASSSEDSTVESTTEGGLVADAWATPGAGWAVSEEDSAPEAVILDADEDVVEHVPA